MERLFNLHTHTHYCDGSSKPEEYVRKAIGLGFHTLGFSSHAPLPIPTKFGIEAAEVSNYVNEIRALQQKYKNEISIFLSLEIDFIPGITDNFRQIKKAYKLDYVIGSVHLIRGTHDAGLWFIDGPKHEVYDAGLENIFQGDIKKGVRAYYHQINKMLDSQDLDILGHFDKIKMHNRNRYFKEDESWYVKLIEESLDVIQSKNVIVEVNTRGIYKGRSKSLFPGNEILSKLKERQIPITLSSDAHRPEELGLLLKETSDTLAQIGFKELMCFEEQGWEAVPIGN